MEGDTETGESQLAQDSEWTVASRSLKAGTREWTDGHRTRVVTARMGVGGGGIVLEGDDRRRRLYVNLPASLDAVVEVEESYRTEPYQVRVEMVRDDSVRDQPRAVVDSVTVSRAGGAQVTAGALRSLRLGELVDFMLTREPVVERSAGDRLPGVVTIAETNEALRVAGRRSGKRGVSRVDLAKVARVYEDAPNRGRVRAVMKAFDVRERTAKRAIAEARDAQLLPPRS